MFGTAVNGSLADSFATMQNKRTGKRVVGIMGAAQIDRFGNLNSTVIGNYHHPKVRFSGSGGACDVASFVGRTIIFMQHEKRKFVRQVDYLTNPGRLEGPNRREELGLKSGGPAAVITNMAIMGFDSESKEMFLEGFYPGIPPAKILKHMSFRVDASRAIEVPPPSKDELQILRDVCDPQRLILG